MRKVSVIIPVYNDSEVLQALLRHLALADHPDMLEILVVAGGSADNLSGEMPRGIRLLRTSAACRAVQLNAGARAATGKVLCFVHADCLPPLTLVADINQALDAGHWIGCYRLKLTPGNWLLALNSYFSRFVTAFSGGGDQTLYLPKKVFETMGGFNESFCIMEDFELVHRLMPVYGYHVLPKDVLVSSRKYRQNSYLKVNLANYRCFRLYWKQAPPQLIKERYYNWLHQVK
ncbi:TIGR04283 family arsenosugar biosynthesis glycosyltransferase [Pontibacter sp. E15-1]|uniref:TIGR04283 family arsenosugar biosynthesis glycosyltransferase n=1 Tax=Pontibacter sp. E15-1 TaxID=2919918 RepID=UPI001F502524|nr:TIGR04283 family arsenosugar biosynthesis glycosyltransferase [Pontibacter sp. E15-1]MCJ8163211.1 TIGR04283 family arsenosugar biosynthesis glycosyltransferase [Pontibacter sp. E15-1]